MEESCSGNTNIFNVGSHHRQMFFKGAIICFKAKFWVNLGILERLDVNLKLAKTSSLDVSFLDNVYKSCGT